MHSNIKIVDTRSAANRPRRAANGTQGLRLESRRIKEEIILPGQRKKIPTGIKIALPEGYEAQIRPRSGLAINQGITLLNSPGTIDADYRGEIALIVINLGEEPFIVKRGMRLAQMIIQKICRLDWVETAELTNTSRGSGGFGHT